MFAVWEYEEDSWRFNLILKLIKDLMALTSDGKLFQKCAPPPPPPVAGTTFQKIGTGIRKS